MKSPGGRSVGPHPSARLFCAGRRRPPRPPTLRPAALTSRPPRAGLRIPIEPQISLQRTLSVAGLRGEPPAANTVVGVRDDKTTAIAQNERIPTLWDPRTQLSVHLRPIA